MRERSGPTFIPPPIAVPQYARVMVPGTKAIAEVPVLDVLAERSRWEGDCLVFVGPRGKKAVTYGQLSVLGETGRTLLVGVHRLMWMAHNGPILDGSLVLHSCDNPPCINPEHLRLGTDVDNARDRTERGRWSRGSRLVA